MQVILCMHMHTNAIRAQAASGADASDEAQNRADTMHAVFGSFHSDAEMWLVLLASYFFYLSSTPLYSSSWLNGTWSSPPAPPEYSLAVMGPTVAWISDNWSS